MLTASAKELALPESSGASLPADIMWMPAGRQEITATSPDGEPMKLSLEVTPQLAAVVARAFNQMKEEATAGRGPLPYFDLNHEDREASGHPTEFFWAGSDPKTGGIRARVMWTEAGAAAIRGRTFRAFSPSFHVDDAGNFVGVSPNLGGMVNRPAFKSIQPIWAKSGEHLLAAKDFETAVATACEGGLTMSAAIDLVLATAPQLHATYRAKGCGPLRETVVEPKSFDEAMQVYCRAGRSVSAALDVLVANHPSLYSKWREAAQMAGW